MSDEPTRDERAPAWSLDQTDVLAPTRVLAGKYRLGRLLGEGGMGAVYEAEHIELGSKVAVKLLSDHYATNPTAAKRVRREARAMAAIRHDNIVTVSDTGSDNGTPYIVMELLEGESLNALLKRQGRLPPTLAAAVVLQVLDGVAAAHAQGVVHRDLKPGNIFLTRINEGDPRVKLLDFGVSKVASETEETTLTVTGAAVGTPLYMSPEQLRGEPDIDGRSDLYAVGVLLYRMVTGKLPGAAIPPAERRAAILHGSLPPPSEIFSETPDSLEKVIVKAMAVEPDYRYPDASRMREAIAEAAPDAATALSRTATKATATAVRPHRPRRRPVVAAVAALLCLAGAAFGIWWTYGRSGPESASGPGEREAASGKGVVVGPGGPTLKLGMSTYFSREKQEKEYGPIARHLEERLGRAVELKIFPDRESLGQSFLSGEVGIAALPPGYYVQLKNERPGIELLATTMTPGGSSFQVHIVTRAESAIEDLEDLRGEPFCYVSSADSGYLFPRDMLRRAGLDPDDAVERVMVDSGHIAALRHVAHGRCSATAVYGGLYYSLDEHDLSQQSFHILESSESIPNDAYCASDELDDETVEALREALLELEPGSETAARVFSQGQKINGFGPTTDDAYDRVREAVRRDERSASGDD